MASFEIPPTNIGSHRVVAVDQMVNSTSVAYTISSASAVDVKMDVGAIYFRGEVAEFYVLISQSGMPFNASTLVARLFLPGGTVQDLSGAVTTVGTGIYTIDYTVPGNAMPGTYALVVNASMAFQGISRYGSALTAFQVSQTFGKMNATLEAINGTLGSLSLDIGPVLVRLDEINASLSSLLLTSKGEILARISSTGGSITSKLDILSASLTSISNGLATVSTSLGSILTELGTIEAKVDSISGDIVRVSSDIGSLNVSLSDINPKLAEIQGGILTLITDLGKVNVTAEDLKLRSIELEGKIVKIETDVGTIVTILENLTGLSVQVGSASVQTGKRITLLSDMNLLSATYSGSEVAIDIKCGGKDEGSGRLAVIMPKELLTLLGSSTSDLKLSENGKEVAFSIQEFPGAYVVQAARDQGQHELILYLKGYPSWFQSSWQLIFILLFPAVLAVLLLFRRLRLGRARTSRSLRFLEPAATK